MSKSNVIKLFSLVGKLCNVIRRMYYNNVDNRNFSLIYFINKYVYEEKKMDIHKK